MNIKKEVDEILNLQMDDNDANAKTVGEYLSRLFCQLWLEGEGFSGKLPFGNSGWEYDIYLPLVIYGKVDGCLDDEGCLEDVDVDAADRLITNCIKTVFLDR